MRKHGWVSNSTARPAAPERPRGPAQHLLQRVHVLEAQQKHHAIEAASGQRRLALELSGIGHEEAPVVAVARAGNAHEARTRVYAGVAGACGGDGRGENTRPGADIEDMLTGLRAQQPQHRRDGEVTMVGATVRPNPAAVPVGDRVPTAGSGAAP